MKKITGYLFRKTKRRKGERGAYLAVILVFAALFLALATSIVTWSFMTVKVARTHNAKISSMSVAEAGIDYYMWHLSHSPVDYCDGTTCHGSAPYGPFTHNYTDISGNVIGSYDLYITPPSTGSAVTTVKSVGRVTGDTLTKTIVSTIGMPSFTKYTLLVNNSELWVGSGEKVNGSVFVNHSGMKNDGEITGDAFSTELTYYSQMFNQTLAGINGSGKVDGTASFPVTPVDFSQLNVDILNIRNNARDNGQGDYYAASGKLGYHIILGSTTYEVRTVSKYDATGYNITKEGAGTTYNYPAAGIVFCEDNVWVEGTINNQKVTILAAVPGATGSQTKRIIIPNNIKYTNYDGRDKIGLITQTDILVTQDAPNDMEIDAAMIAQAGQIRIDHYQYEHKGHMKVYGSMAHNTGLVWTYCYNSNCSLWSGYQTTETDIDQSNILQPPPKFPLTGSYAVLSWREQ